MDISFFIVAFGVPLAGCGTLMAVAVIAHRWPMPDWLDNLMIAQSSSSVRCTWRG